MFRTNVIVPKRYRFPEGYLQYLFGACGKRWPRESESAFTEGLVRAPFDFFDINAKRRQGGGRVRAAVLCDASGMQDPNHFVAYPRCGNLLVTQDLAGGAAVDTGQTEQYVFGANETVS